MKDKKVIRSHQHGCKKAKLCLTVILHFCNKMTSLVDEENAVNIAVLGFSKAFDSVSHMVLIEKLLTYKLD